LKNLKSSSKEESECGVKSCIGRSQGGEEGGEGPFKSFFPSPLLQNINDANVINSCGVKRDSQQEQQQKEQHREGRRRSG
jgi:hypothetical protein